MKEKFQYELDHLVFFHVMPPKKKKKNFYYLFIF